MGNQFDNLSQEAHPSESVASLSLAPVVREYLRLYAEGVGHTARAKQLDADKLLEFLRRYKRAHEIESLEVKDWSFSSTQRFVDDCLRQGEAPATVARRLATIKHMGRILAERLPGFINPAREVKPPRQQACRPKSITPEEIADIKEKARTATEERSSFSALRNQTLLYLLLDTGLRADEIRTLRMSQLGESLEWIKQVRTKGRRFRDVYITSAMREALRNYLTARKQELSRYFPTLSAVVDAKLPLFISLYRASSANPKSFEMGAKTIWRAIRSCSVNTKLHPHLLRHTYATELLEDSRDIRLVAQALGHSDVRVTMRYTERGNEEVAEALEKARRGRSKQA
jgi:integrase/recombinase XerC